MKNKPNLMHLPRRPVISRADYVVALLLVLSQPAATEADWPARAEELRGKIREILNLPEERIDLRAEVHRKVEAEDYVIEAVSYASEPGSRITASLYLPKTIPSPRAAILAACGHGGSKSGLYAQYAGQLYAKQGFACLIPDTIGEEEREETGGLGARGHDLYRLGDKNPEFVRNELRRMVLGKIVWDLSRSLDYLESRPEIDPERLGVVGYSLGGASGGCLAVLESRVHAAVLCGWVFSERYATYGKYCTRMPYREFAKIMTFDEMTALLGPHCPTFFMCGDRDEVIDPEGKGSNVVQDFKTLLPAARERLQGAGLRAQIWGMLKKDAGHRPFFLSSHAVDWLREHLLDIFDKVRPAPTETVLFGEWADARGATIEKLYNTEARERGLEALDVGAVYRDPKELACFPDQEKPSPEYTMEGWVDSVLAAQEGGGGPP